MIPTLHALAVLLPAFASAPFQAAPEAPAAEEAPAADDAADDALPERPPVRVEGTMPLSWADEVRWRSIGPANMGGRITDIAVNPTDASEAWIATATGGVVHTTNRGVTYEHQFTNQRVSSIGAIAAAPSDPTVVWLGTGEANPRNSCSWGDGVYVSRDSGATWRHAGLERSFQISSIVVHPDDPNVVYVGALGRLWGPNDQRGLYKTVDGGRTWEQLHHVDADTGVVEVKMHPEDPNTIVFATYERRRDMFDTNDPAVKWGDGSGLWRTTDGGKTFERLEQGLPTGELGRVGMCWSGSNPDNLFAVVETNRITQEPDNAAWFGVSFEAADFGAKVTKVEEASPAEEAGIEKGDVVLRIADVAIVDQAKLRRTLRDHFAGDTAKLEVLRDGDVMTLEITFDRRPEDENEALDVHGRRRDGPFGIGLGGQRANAQDQQGPEGFEFGGIFKSTDRGTTWTRINSLNPRPMYYSEIRVDPSDENYIYVLGTRLHRSSDGGETFTSDGHDGSVHVDHHALWIDPADGRRMILGNDGGIYVTEDRMEHWDHHNKLALGQFYNVTVGPRMHYNVYGGLQDNGSWGGPSRTADSGATNDDWFRVGGGDGFRCLVDPNNPDLVYYESQNGGLGRRDFSSGQGNYLKPRAPRRSKIRYRFNWNTPFLLSNFNSGIYYSAGNHVFRSVRGGVGQEPISPEITATDRGAAVSLAESPRDADILYVGTDDGALWMTEDGGDEWVDLMALNGAPAFEEGADEGEVPASVVTEERARKASSAPIDDGPAGTWACKAEGAGIEGGSDGAFTLTFSVDENGKVSGSLDSEIGDGPLSQVRWKASSGELSFKFKGSDLTMAFDAEVDGEKGTMKGSITAAGDAFRFSFTGAREGAPAAKEDAPVASEAKEASDDVPASEEKEKKKSKPEKPLENTIDQLLPGRRYVGELFASRHKTSRVYAGFDGHRSNDDAPYIFASEDRGRTWRSLHDSLPAEVGSVRAFHEDIENEDVLYLGTEFGAYVSIDRGETWTRMNGDTLPTVPVHDFAQHTGTGELVAGTHGRSVWIANVTAYSQMSKDLLEEDAVLFAPKDVHLRARARSHGRQGNHGFVGQNPYSGAEFAFLKMAKGPAVLEVLDATGKVVRTLEPEDQKGLTVVRWDLRTGSQGEGRRRRRPRVSPGTYRVRLMHGGQEHGVETFTIHNDPEMSTTEWTAFEDAEEEFEALFGDDEGGDEERRDL